GGVVGGAKGGGEQAGIWRQGDTDVPERQHVRVALVELAVGDSAVDHVAHVLVDRRLGFANVGDLFFGEPLGDVRAFLEVHGSPVDVVGDVLQQPTGEV